MAISLASHSKASAAGPRIVPSSPFQTIHSYALDAVGSFGSAAYAWGEGLRADEKHDRCLTQARLCFSRGEYAMGDYWAEQAQFWNAYSGRKLGRCWRLVEDAVEACRQIVATSLRHLTAAKGASR